jgi:hypothetical protein
MYEKIKITEKYLYLWAFLMITGSLFLTWSLNSFVETFSTNIHFGYMVLVMIGCLSIFLLLLDVFAHAYRVTCLLT